MSVREKLGNWLLNYKAAGVFKIFSLAYTSGGRLSGSGGGTLKFSDAVAKGYKGLVWVHRCVSEIGQAVGSVPWKTYRMRSDGTKIQIPGHELGQLIEKPNPYYDRRDLMSSWAIYLSLSGNAYWEIVHVDSKPKELYSLRPDWLTPIPDPIRYIRGYALDAGRGNTNEFTVEEMMHFKYLDPLNEYVGMSPLQAAQRTMETEEAAVNWNKSVFDNAAMPGGFLKVPGQLTKPQRQKLEEDLAREFSGSNLGKPMLLWGGLEWQKMSMDQKDLDWLKQRHLNKYEICAILGVPPQIVGANEDPTYANYDIARTAFWEDTIIPLLEWLQAKINNTLAPYWGKDIVAGYDISDVPAMRKSFQQKVETAKTLFMMGYPPNAINRRLTLGFDDLPWGDVWWANMNLMPVDSPNIPLSSPTASPVTTPPKAPGKEGIGEDPFSGEVLP